VFSALSTLEAYSGNSAQGRRFEEIALRYKYTGDDPDHDGPVTSISRLAYSRAAATSDRRSRIE
jgi:hypothetical protein